jgi:galactokinase
MSNSFFDFHGKEPSVRAHAPGRIEFIGNHTDYNGGLVMGVALNKGIVAEAAPRTDNIVRLTSSGESQAVEIPLGNIQKQKGKASWANYVLGVLVTLQDMGMKAIGFDLHVQSDLPSGAGLSSSAALELSTACVLTKLCNFPLDKAALARVGRKAENEFVGMPCGILDQGVSAFGQKDAIVRIDCASETFSIVPMPHGLRFWVFNSMEKHSLVGSLYATRHAECMEALRLLRLGGVNAANLASVSPADVRKANLPANIGMRALHVCEEHRRVDAMGEALKAGDYARIGRLLSASHESSRTLFENSTDKLDCLVDILGRTPHVLGARLTGGGFGGAAMALATAQFGNAEAVAVCEQYARQNEGVVPAVFTATAGEGARLL